jgi:hypothetical protein
MSRLVVLATSTVLAGFQQSYLQYVRRPELHSAELPHAARMAARRTGETAHVPEPQIEFLCSAISTHTRKLIRAAVIFHTGSASRYLSIWRGSGRARD